MLHTILSKLRGCMLSPRTCQGVRKVNTDNKIERRLSLSEITALGMAMGHADEESPVALAAIRLMLLTGFRRMEVLTLKRAWIDAEAPCVRFPKTKSGAQLRAIGQPASSC